MKTRALFVLVVSLPLLAQPRRPVRQTGAESAIRQAMEQLGQDKKAIDRDMEVLRLLRVADSALTDPMQPTVALEKADDAVDKAKQLNPDFTVVQEVIRAERALEDARRSPGSADFPRLRVVVRSAVNAASRSVVRNAIRLQEETVAWVRIQQTIGDHVRTLSEITGDSLRAAEQ